MQRRRLMKLGLLTGATGAFAIAAKANPNQATLYSNDTELFNGAIILEQKAINTYTAAAENGLLPTRAYLDMAVEFAGDHAEHRDRLKLVVKDVFKGEAVETSNLGTFPLPDSVLNGTEADVLRYALVVEMLAAKTYFENICDKLTTNPAKNLAAAIMPVEAQHVAVYRTVLKTAFNAKGLPGDRSKVVPFAFLSTQPTPNLPMGSLL